MEKTTKKRKKSKGAKKRIGIIAVGGLSLVLTICLSVGATLAWFAGSTWSSNQMYMGGPVYVEMAGLGASAGTAGNSAEGADKQAAWQGGAGNLNIQAATTRTTGTVDFDHDGKPDTDPTIPNNILLPGQKFEIYSQARVFSTARTSSVGTDVTNSQNSGANVTNTTKGNGKTHITDKGRVTTTTTSVLRARFSISVDFDPTVGFNNFTDEAYRANYPKQSQVYTGHYAVNNTATTSAESGDGLDVDTAVVKAGDAKLTAGEAPETNTEFDSTTGKYKALSWQSANSAAADDTKTFINTNTTNLKNQPATYPLGARRDRVLSSKKFTASVAPDNTDPTNAEALAASTGLAAVRAGTMKSIFAWKFVSKNVYDNTTTTAAAINTAATPKPETSEKAFATSYSYVKMPAPFDGSDKSYGENGYYGVWILGDAVNTGTEAEPVMKKFLSESDSFYKERCNSYIDSYVEEYVTEYDEIKTRTIGNSLKALENSLNQSFVNLVNDSSDAICEGHIFGMYKDADGNMQYTANPDTSKYTAATVNAVNPTWLYIDPTIGNDTNTNELSTSTGGWWYLVESDGGSVKNNLNRVAMTTDSVAITKGVASDDPLTTDIDETKDHWDPAITKNTITGATPNYTTAKDDAAGTAVAGTDFFVRNTENYTAGTDGKLGTEDDVYVDTTFGSKDPNRLKAKLYEIDPLMALGTEKMGYNNGDITKVVSFSFPFVNGSSALPGDALTNVFANAKITIQISFQALQAFFPFSAVIDNMDYTNPLLGTAKALNIKNAIPIFNEAFDYQESLDDVTVEGL